MKRLLGALLVVLSAAGCGGDSGPTAPSAPNQPPGAIAAPTDPEAASFVEQMNAHRLSIGLQPLTGNAVLAAWLNSSGHRANIENANFTHHGVGKAGTSWTHVFIRASTSAAGPIAARSTGTPRSR